MMNTKRVVVLPYDEAWKDDFGKIKAELMTVLDGLVLSIEHVGSTSVPGLAAKPIIDIDVVIEGAELFEKVRTALETIGYHHEGDLGIKGREAFKYDGKDHLRKHHLYVCSKDSKELKRHIAFRDYLLTHPDAVKEYGRIKEEGARLYPNDIDKYIEYKSPFIEKIYAGITESENKIKYLDHGGTTCYLLKTDESVLLIDTGLFGNLKALDNWLGACKVDYVFLTHGHVDHDWNALAFQKRGAKIILSEKDKDLPRHYMSQPVQPTMRKYRFRNFTQHVNGSIFRTHKYTPDVLIGDNWDYLKSLGFNAEIVPLPGHTYGSLGILSDNVLYCGDSFTALWGRPDITPHAVSIELMKESLEKILKIDPEWLACGHGLPLKMEDAKPVIRAYLGY